MNLMQHAMNIGGFGKRGDLNIKPGFTVTWVQWDGCMATIRNEVDHGEVIQASAPSLHDNGKYPGVIVLWEKGGKQWEPLDYFGRSKGGELEVWR